MALDDRAADGKPHSHAPRFRSEQRLENAVHVGWAIPLLQSSLGRYEN